MIYNKNLNQDLFMNAWMHECMAINFEEDVLYIISDNRNLFGLFHATIQSFNHASSSLKGLFS